MSDSLRQRARAFLQSPIPKDLDYAPGSIAERVIAAYADQGAAGLDGELRELLEICVMESEGAAGQAQGEVKAYFEESAGILGAIMNEIDMR